MSSYFRLFMKNVAAQEALRKVKENKSGKGRTGKGRTYCPERIRIDDETDCDLVLQGLYHMLKTPASTLTSVWLSENSRN